jgi:hypothetical protein
LVSSARRASKTSLRGGKLTDAFGGRRTNAAGGAAVDLREHARHRGRMVAAIDPVADVLLQPHDFAFFVDEGADRRAAQAGRVLRFQIVAEQERLVAAREQDVHRTGDSADVRDGCFSDGGGTCG